MRVRATLRLRNDAMIAARESRGMNQFAAASFCGVPSSVLMALEKFRVSEWTKETVLRHAESIATAFGLSVQDVAPDDLFDAPVVSEFTATGTLDAKALIGAGEAFAARMALPAGSVAEAAEVSDAMRKAIDALPFRLRSIIELRWGLNGEPPMTLEAVAKIHKVTRERVRSLEAMALHRLGRNSGLSTAVIGLTRTEIDDESKARNRRFDEYDRERDAESRPS